MAYQAVDHRDAVTEVFGTVHPARVVGLPFLDSDRPFSQMTIPAGIEPLPHVAYFSLHTPRLSSAIYEVGEYRATVSAVGHNAHVHFVVDSVRVEGSTASTLDSATGIVENKCLQPKSREYSGVGSIQITPRRREIVLPGQAIRLSGRVFQLAPHVLPISVGVQVHARVFLHVDLAEYRLLHEEFIRFIQQKRS